MLFLYVQAEKIKEWHQRTLKNNNDIPLPLSKYELKL